MHKNKSKVASLIAPIALIALAAGVFGMSQAHADTAGNYKQAFTASGASASGVFDVSGDEGSVSYWLGGATSGTLSCQASNGSWVSVANLSGSGTINSSNLLSTASYCNPNITTTAHLIQAMREGKIAFVVNGMPTWLSAGAISNVPPVVTMPGDGTSTTTPTTPTDGTSTPPMTGSTTPVIGAVDPILGTTTVSAYGLGLALDEILRSHVSTSIDVLRVIANMPAGATSSPELTAALAQQDQNAVDLSNAIGLVYGPDANSAFLAMFRAHIVDSNAYTMALKNGSMTDQQAALAALDVQLQNIASFLSTANPNLDNAGLLAALRAHENLVNLSSTDYASGDYSGAYTVEQQALTQISGGADYIAGGIVAQYPGSFTK